MKHIIFSAAVALAFISALGIAAAEPDPDLLTAAERSGFRATATHAQTVELVDRLAARSELAHRESMGASFEGRDIPLLIIADPPVRSPADIGDRVVVFLLGGIHSGEACGKEALLILARELLTEPGAPANRAILDNLVLLIAPIYNPDGNERVSPDNRPGQIGPELGMGQRANAQGLDLNRDNVKLQSPEARAQARLLSLWSPHITIDTHTTNGSRIRYDLTYAAPLNPSGHPAPIAFVRDQLLPSVTERLRTRTGYETFFYGNFSRDLTRWETYSAHPRFGGPYRGLRNRMSILSEAYAYIPFERRVDVTLEFIRECLAYAAEHAQQIRGTLAQAERDTIRAGAAPRHDDLVGVRHTLAKLDQPASLRSYAVVLTGEEITQTDEPAILTVEHWGRFEPTHSVTRPVEYLIPASLTPVIDNLRAHGVRLHPFLDAEALIESARIDAVHRAERAFQGHNLVTLDVTMRRDMRRLEGDYLAASTAQPLGNLIVYLLEPMSEDGLAAWGFLDDHLTPGAEYPILRAFPIPE